MSNAIIVESVECDGEEITLESMNLPLNTAITWKVEDAPSDVDDLANLARDEGHEPRFISFVPDELRFTHTPENSLVEMPIDGGVFHVTN